MWLDMYEQFSDLTKDERIKLFFAMKKDLFPDSTANISNKNGLVCVHCGSMSVKRHGQTLSEVAGKGRITALDIRNFN